MEITWQETSPHRDRGQETDYPQVGLGSRDLGFANCATNRSIPAWVWLANNAQVLWDVTTGHKVTHAVITVTVTVPAYFNDAQCQATKDAGITPCLRVRHPYHACGPLPGVWMCPHHTCGSLPSVWDC